MLASMIYRFGPFELDLIKVELRVVSEAAVASRVRSARQALGDNGTAQRFIKTIHGQGFRFVAEAKVARGAHVADPLVASASDLLTALPTSPSSSQTTRPSQTRCLMN